MNGQRLGDIEYRKKCLFNLLSFIYLEKLINYSGFGNASGGLPLYVFFKLKSKTLKKKK